MNPSFSQEPINRHLLSISRSCNGQNLIRLTGESLSISLILRYSKSITVRFEIAFASLSKIADCGDESIFNCSLSVRYLGKSGDTDTYLFSFSFPPCIISILQVDGESRERISNDTRSMRKSRLRDEFVFGTPSAAQISLNVAPAEPHETRKVSICLSRASRGAESPRARLVVVLEFAVIRIRKRLSTLYIYSRICPRKVTQPLPYRIRVVHSEPYSDMCVL